MEISKEDFKPESNLLLKNFMSIEDETNKSTIKLNTRLSYVRSPSSDANKKSFSSNLLNYKIRNYSNIKFDSNNNKNNEIKNRNSKNNNKNSLLNSFKDLFLLEKLNPDCLDSPNFDERIKNSFKFKNNKSIRKSPNKLRDVSGNNANGNNASANNITLNKIAIEFQRKSSTNFTSIQNNNNNINININNNIKNINVEENKINSKEKFRLKSTSDAENLTKNGFHTNNNIKNSIRNSFSSKFRMQNKRRNNTSTNKLCISVIVADKNEVLNNSVNFKKKFNSSKNNFEKINKKSLINRSCEVNAIEHNKTENNNENAFLEIKNDLIEKVNGNFAVLNLKKFNLNNEKANLHRKNQNSECFVRNKINYFFESNSKKPFFGAKSNKKIIKKKNNTINYKLKDKSNEFAFETVNATFQGNENNFENQLNQSRKNFLWNESYFNSDCKNKNKKPKNCKNIKSNVDPNLSIKIKGISKGKIIKLSFSTFYFKKKLKKDKFLKLTRILISQK